MEDVVTISMIDHVNIVTERLEETRAFFVDVLGLAVGARPPFAVEGYWLYAGSKPIVHMQRAPTPVCPSEASALNHFAFAAEDFDPMIERLLKHGVAHRVVIVPGTTARQVFFHDPNSVRVEITEAVF
jgi:catechol 2,3-dioxygenase-like lactoylglutathione lyase family enzyme